MSEVQKETCNDYLEREYTQASGNGGQPTRLMIQSILYGNIQQFIRERQCTSDALRIYKEQNWNGQANLPPKRRVDNYYGCAGFWVPNVRKNVVQKAVEKTKNTVAKTQTIKTTWDWSGKFNAGTTIKVRKQPGLAGQILNRDRWLEKNDSVEFVSITKKDNYWWIKFKQDGEFVYCAITKMTDLKGRIKYEKDLFGTIKWY